MPFLLLAACVFLVAEPAFACIWSYGTDLRGKKVEVNGIAGVDLVLTILQKDTHTNWERERREHAERAARTPHPEVRNDYAVTLLHVGATAEAIRILEAIEREKPGLYVTAVNLGTALELAGRNEDALRWIREGIRRNRNAHDGTEWLHARILEAKIALARDPRWLEKNSALGLDFGRNVVPQSSRTWPADNAGRRATQQAVQRALYYQLDERVDFVSPPDPVVANLLFDWANLAMLTATLQTAEALYVRALAFGPQNAPLVRSRLAHVRQLLKQYKAK